jgi:hypothetical protein
LILEQAFARRVSSRLEGWQGEGSLAHWLSVRGGYTIGEAHHFATAAIRLDNVGAIHADAGRGSVP